VEQQSLYNSIDFTLAVESPTNLKARTTTLRVYSCPSDTQTGVFTVVSWANKDLAAVATNSYAANYGGGVILDFQAESGNGLFARNSRVRARDVSDGLSSTLALGERTSSFVQSSWPGVVSHGTARTTPNAPVYTSYIHPASVLVLARVNFKSLNDPYS